jgi:hypothetical protein
MKTRIEGKFWIVAMGLLTACLLLLGSFFWFIFYIRYWKWRVEIEQVNSSFITPEGDNLTSGGFFRGFPTLGMSICGLLLLVFVSSGMKRLRKVY